MDLFDALSNAGDDALDASSVVDHQELPDASAGGCGVADGGAQPANKRRRAEGYSSKVGCGVLGLLLIEAMALLGYAYKKVMEKTCVFCGLAFGSEDPVHAGRSRAWHKPRQEGRICGYCGVAKRKLYPGQSAPDVSTQSLIE